MDTKQKFRKQSIKFEPIEQQHKKKQTKRLIFYIVLLVSFTVVFFVLWFAVFFKVKSIEIGGNLRYSKADILEAAGIAEGDNLYEIGEKELNSRLIEALPYIRSATLERKLPSTLVIGVEEDTAVMYSEICGDTYLMSEDLTVLERSDSFDRSKMVELYAGDVSMCYSGKSIEYVDSRMVNVVVKLYAVLKEYGLIDKVNSFTIKNRFDIQIRYDNRLDVYFGSVENIDVKVCFFNGILALLYEDESGRLDISDIKEASLHRYDK